MRHRKQGKKFGRKTGPRKLMLANLATSVILYEKIRTTETKAKAVRPLVERLITRGKTKSLHIKQELSKIVLDKKAIKKIFEVLGPRYKDRPGGYTRIVKLGQRTGDGAPMAQIEFI